MANLASPTGSLINNIGIAATKETPIEIGMGATIAWYSDRDPVTVISYENGILAVQEDKATRTDNLGMSDSQDYEYERNEDGSIFHFKKYKDRWTSVYKNRDTGRWNKSDGNFLILGHRSKYFDYSF